MQTPLEATQVPAEDLNHDARLPMETRETSTDKGAAAIRCSETSDKLINCGETEEHAASIEHKGD